MKKIKQYFPLLVVFAILFFVASCSGSESSVSETVSDLLKSTEVIENVESSEETTAADSASEIAGHSAHEEETYSTVEYSETVIASAKKNEEKTVTETTAAKTSKESKPEKYSPTARKVTAKTTTEKAKPVYYKIKTTKSETNMVQKENGNVIVSETNSETTKQETKAEKVKVKVNCRHAVEYGANNVPKSGVILDTEVACYAGDTAMDVLKRALVSDNISVDENHGYIRGIAGLKEKECGASSGWMYMVNSEIPMSSADKYAVYANDTVTFYYVTSYGDKA